MRVYELAKELEVKSWALVQALQAMGVEVTTPTSAVTEAEAERARRAWAAERERAGQAHSAETDTPAETEAGAAEATPEATAEAEPRAAAAEGGSTDTGGEPDSDDEDVIVGDGYQQVAAETPVSGMRWRLSGKASVLVPGVAKVQKGELVGAGVYRRLPHRVQRFFELVRG